jgi:hypothetical protein
MITWSGVAPVNVWPPSKIGCPLMQPPTLTASQITAHLGEVWS